MQIKEILSTDKDAIKETVKIHLATFQGFFLTFMGRGFLTQMYKSYCDHDSSGILAAYDGDRMLGFVAYSGDMSGLYKFMIKKRLVAFAWYSLGAFFRRPAAFFRIIRAFLKPGESKREEDYMELSSIGVSPEVKSKGVGSLLVDALKQHTDFTKYAYINLETDAENNEAANRFYVKNGFVLKREYSTAEGRKMNEYRFGEKI